MHDEILGRAGRQSALWGSGYLSKELKSLGWLSGQNTPGGVWKYRCFRVQYLRPAPEQHPAQSGWSRVNKEKAWKAAEVGTRGSEEWLAWCPLSHGEWLTGHHLIWAQSSSLGLGSLYLLCARIVLRPRHYGPLLFRDILITAQFHRAIHVLCYTAHG